MQKKVLQRSMQTTESESETTETRVPGTDRTGGPPRPESIKTVTPSNPMRMCASWYERSMHKNALANLECELWARMSRST
jgi:hypothetical protein